MLLRRRSGIRREGRDGPEQTLGKLKRRDPRVARPLQVLESASSPLASPTRALVAEQDDAVPERAGVHELECDPLL
jgi:hypothetical protein